MVDCSKYDLGRQALRINRDGSLVVFGWFPLRESDQIIRYDKYYMSMQQFRALHEFNIDEYVSFIAIFANHLYRCYRNFGCRNEMRFVSDFANYLDKSVQNYCIHKYMHKRLEANESPRNARPSDENRMQLTNGVYCPELTEPLFELGMLNPE